MGEYVREMVWTGNELVFSDAPRVGVAGIAPDQPDGLGQQIADSWNRSHPCPECARLREELTEAKAWRERWEPVVEGVCLPQDAKAEFRITFRQVEDDGTHALNWCCGRPVIRVSTEWRPVPSRPRKPSPSRRRCEQKDGPMNGVSGAS